ncbi:MAG: hypothetical protein ACRDGM_05225 [bacterium]
MAAIVLEELASEKRWTDLFEKSQDKFAKLAEKALSDHAADFNLADDAAVTVGL